MAQARSTNSRDRILRMRQTRKREKRRKFLLWLLGVGCIIGLIIFLARLPRLQITTVTVLGNEVLATKDIEDEVRATLSGNYFFVFPKTNALLYPKNTLRKDLLKKFPRLKTLEINHPSLEELVIGITERRSIYLWCGPTLLSEEKKSCYYTDEKGYIFSKSPYFSGEVYFKFYGAKVPLDENNPLTESIADLELFSKLLTFKDSLTQIGLNPYALILSETESKFLVTINDTTTRIILSDKNDFGRVFTTLSSALTVEPLASALKEGGTPIDYIDLRYANKVYFKFLK